MSRYKLASENAEKIEDELKVEKRKLQREARPPSSVGLFLSLFSSCLSFVRLEWDVSYRVSYIFNFRVQVHRTSVSKKSTELSNVQRNVYNESDFRMRSKCSIIQFFLMKIET